MTKKHKRQRKQTAQQHSLSSFKIFALHNALPYSWTKMSRIALNSLSSINTVSICCVIMLSWATVSLSFFKAQVCSALALFSAAQAFNWASARVLVRLALAVAHWSARVCPGGASPLSCSISLFPCRTRQTRRCVTDFPVSQYVGEMPMNSLSTFHIKAFLRLEEKHRRRVGK